MMRWKVTGADRASGADKQVVIEAINRDEATRMAGKAGMVISSVELALYGEASPPATPAKKGSSVGERLIGAVVFLIFFGVAYNMGCCCGLGGGGGGSDSSSSRSTTAPPSAVPPANEPDKIAAWVMAQQFVKKRLRSPGTADFGSVFGDYQDPDERASVVDAKTFHVTGWVDSQNGFGAIIRTQWSCDVTFEGNDQWSCQTLRMW